MFEAPYYVDIICYNGHLGESIICDNISEVASYYYNGICDIHVYDCFNNRIPNNILSMLCKPYK